MTTPNAALAYVVLDLALAHPSNLNMHTWADDPDGHDVDLHALTKTDCGTTACYAGWTAAHAGWLIDANGMASRDGNRRLVDHLAAELLGIDMDQAHYLFNVYDEELPDAVADIFGPRPDAEVTG